MNRVNDACCFEQPSHKLVVQPVQQSRQQVLRAYCPNVYTVDSGIFNEFATAAFRFGHSLIPEGFKIKSHGLTKLLLNLNDTQSMVYKKR